MMLGTSSAEALAGQPLDDLAAGIQKLASRIATLATTTDETLDHCGPEANREALGRVFDLLDLIGEAATSLKIHGEAVEIVGMARRKEAA